MRLGPRIPAHILKQALERLDCQETSTVELEQQLADGWLGSEARAAEALYLLDLKHPRREMQP
jgi:hypothetical protein